MINILVIIPAYNEQATVAHVVSEALKIGRVLVVDDGSKDLTASEAKGAGAEVVSLGGNSGYENAVSEGYRIALERSYEFALTMDADGQHNAESGRALINSIGKSDIAIGTRSKKPRIFELLGGLIGHYLWGVSDLFSGMKLYRLSSCSKIGKFDNYRLVGAELAVRAHRAGLNIVTIPISVNMRADSPRIGTSLSTNIRIGRAIAILLGIKMSWIK